MAHSPPPQSSTGNHAKGQWLLGTTCSVVATGFLLPWSLRLTYLLDILMTQPIVLPLKLFPDPRVDKVQPEKTEKTPEALGDCRPVYPLWAAAAVSLQRLLIY